MKKTTLNGQLGLVGLVVSSLITMTAQAATVSGGVLTINLYPDALIAGTLLDKYPNTPIQVPSIYLEEFYDASAAGKTFNELRESNTPTDPFDVAANEISAKNLQFTVNGSSSPVNPIGRHNRATDFEFNPDDLLASATGSIGLNGVLRFRVDVLPPNNRILLGDMSMEYKPELEGATPGRSGWVITNHIGFDAGAFELFNVTTQLIGNNLSLNGNLGFGDGFDHLGSEAARIAAEKPIGNFSFQTTVVPVPSAIWLFASGIGGIFFSRRSYRKLAS